MPKTPALAWRLPATVRFSGMVAITRVGLVPAAIVARELDMRIIDTVCVASYAAVKVQTPRQRSEACSTNKFAREPYPCVGPPAKPKRPAQPPLRRSMIDRSTSHILRISGHPRSTQRKTRQCIFANHPTRAGQSVSTINRNPCSPQSIGISGRNESYFRARCSCQLPISSARQQWRRTGVASYGLLGNAQSSDASTLHITITVSNNLGIPQGRLLRKPRLSEEPFKQGSQLRC